MDDKPGNPAEKLRSIGQGVDASQHLVVFNRVNAPDAEGRLVQALELVLGDALDQAESDVNLLTGKDRPKPGRRPRGG